jgi:hypothetical protein
MPRVVANGGDTLFAARTPLGFAVHVTRQRWELITTSKHPAMAGREGDVKLALERPDEVRKSVTDDQVLLFYKAERASRWVCAVAKHAGERGLLITAYPTDAIKEGVRVWPT